MNERLNIGKHVRKAIAGSGKCLQNICTNSYSNSYTFNRYLLNWVEVVFVATDKFRVVSTHSYSTIRKLQLLLTLLGSDIDRVLVWVRLLALWNTCSYWVACLPVLPLPGCHMPLRINLNDIHRKRRKEIVTFV